MSCCNYRSCSSTIFHLQISQINFSRPGTEIKRNIRSWYIFFYIEVSVRYRSLVIVYMWFKVQTIYALIFSTNFQFTIIISSYSFKLPSKTCPQEFYNSCKKVFYRSLRILRVQERKLIGKCYILDPPFEILEHIFTYLPLPSNVCLALCSKTLHLSFSSVLEAKELGFPLFFQKKAYVMTEEY